MALSADLRITGSNGFEEWHGAWRARAAGVRCTEASALALDQQVVGDAEHRLEHAVSRGPHDGFVEITVGQHHRGQIACLDATLECGERRRNGARRSSSSARVAARAAASGSIARRASNSSSDAVVIQGFPTGERLIVRQMSESATKTRRRGEQ